MHLCYQQDGKPRAWLQAGAARRSHSSPLAERGYLSFHLEEVTESSPKSCPITHLQALPENQGSPCSTASSVSRTAPHQLLQSCWAYAQSPLYKYESPECCWLPVDPAMLHSPALASQGRLGYLRAGRPSFPPAGMCFWVQKASGKAKPPQLCYLILWLQLFAKKVSFFLLLIINGACFQARISR